ncbi:hypothetical protein GY45DRAFT_1338507 [Cubamyces sp. BRFM 1775]|nr:hypothetical protein GY45DRAFT_1338507 [Cubamyces sp. BRFM 1775]
MANWIDYLSLVLTFSIITALVYGGFVAVKATSEAVQSTKEKLKTKGVNVSKHGVSVKTNKRYDREDYLDATQRGFIKAMKASSAGNQSDKLSNGATKEEGSSSDKSERYHLRSRRAHAVDK